ncbi:hypothetical protein GY45DRAFT_751451 [Cubamyces sp. BRFM 1775]|nr:hypothetical protein GY45DRAFT_751451 [Cubamyces sp. BRFM 1775]
MIFCRRSSAEERERLAASGRVTKVVASSCARGRHLTFWYLSSLYVEHANDFYIGHPSPRALLPRLRAQKKWRSIPERAEAQSAETETSESLRHGVVPEDSPSSTVHLVSDEDAMHLESLASLRRLCPFREEKKKRRLSQRALLLRFGRHLSLPHRPGQPVAPYQLLSILSLVITANRRSPCMCVVVRERPVCPIRSTTRNTSRRMTPCRIVLATTMNMTATTRAISSDMSPNRIPVSPSTCRCGTCDRPSTHHTLMHSSHHVLLFHSAPDKLPYHSPSSIGLYYVHSKDYHMSDSTPLAYWSARAVKGHQVNNVSFG